MFTKRKNTAAEIVYTAYNLMRTFVKLYAFLCPYCAGYQSCMTSLDKAYRIGVSYVHRKNRLCHAAFGEISKILKKSVDKV